MFFVKRARERSELNSETLTQVAEFLVRENEFVSNHAGDFNRLS